MSRIAMIVSMAFAAIASASTLPQEQNQDEMTEMHPHSFVVTGISEVCSLEDIAALEQSHVREQI